MRDTGENYTSARAALLAQEVTRPERLSCAPALLAVPDADAPRAEADAAGSQTVTDAAGPSAGSSALPSCPVDPRTARAEHVRLLRGLFSADGRLTRIPRRRRARLAVLLEVIARFEPGRAYTEAEVRDVVSAVHDDVAFLRRELVDYGYLLRDRAGRSYRLTEAPPAHVGNAAQEVTDWERLWLPCFLAGELSVEIPQDCEVSQG